MAGSLRFAKVRSQNIEIENDLRGLGNTTMLDDLSPEPVLTVHASKDRLHEAARDLGLEVESESQGSTHFVCTKGGLTHKEKSLQLFAYALIIKANYNLHSCLWQRNRLHAALSEGMEAKLAPQSAPEHDHSRVCLDSAIQLYLKQAGFNVATSDAVLGLEGGEVRELLREFSHVQAKQHSIKRVG